MHNYQNIQDIKLELFAITNDLELGVEFVANSITLPTNSQIEPDETLSEIIGNLADTLENIMVSRIRLQSDTRLVKI